MELGGWSSAGRRSANEDSYLIVDLSTRSERLGGLRGFLAVSDGMGGHAHGDVASHAAVKVAQDYVGSLLDMAQDSTLRVDPRVALIEIINGANQAVRTAAGATAGNMGATLTAAFVTRDHVWVGHVGDSRAYVMKGSTAVRLTTDHSRVGRLIADGVITETEGQRHPDRHLIDNALGFDGMQIEVFDRALSRGDAVFLCTDGVSSVLRGEVLLGLVSKAKNASVASRAVCDAAVSADSDDNVTAAMWSEDWSAFCAGVPEGLRSGKALALASGAPWYRRRSVLVSVAAVIVAGAVAVGAWQLAAAKGGEASAVGVTTLEQPSPTAGGAVGSKRTADPDPAVTASTDSSVTTTTLPDSRK